MTAKQKRPIGPRQGDVLVIKVDRLPKGLEPMPVDSRGLVIAEGETSSHYHAIVADGAKLYRFTDRSHTDLVVDVPVTGEVRVIGGGAGGEARHTSGPIESGVYRARVQRRNDAGRARRVKD
jgi:hypothetical protein